jgi:hypothetical protein
MNVFSFYPLFVLMGYVMERGCWSIRCSVDPACVPGKSRLAHDGYADRVHVLGHRQ